MVRAEAFSHVLPQQLLASKFEGNRDPLEQNL